MINVTIGTNTERKSVIVEPSEVIADVLRENNVSTANAAIHLNGSLIPGCDLNCSFEELSVADGTDVMLIAVVKADSAA